MRKEKIPTIKDGIKDVSSWLDAKEENAFRLALGDKAPQRTEIEVSFFQKCNLRCAFCWQDHDDDTGVNDISSKADIVVKYIKEWEYIKDDIAVTMTGGELFQDGVDYYDEYLRFMERVVNESGIDWRRITFFLITNLMFKDPQTANRLHHLIDTCKEIGIQVKIGTSWDLTGRPSNDFFHANLIDFYEHVAGATIVLTKPTIKAFLRGQADSQFDFLYNAGKIDFDYYVPTEYADSMMPSDWDILNVLRLFVAKYPEMPSVEAWLEGEVNPISCGNLNKITILPDGSLVPCRQLDYCDSDFKTPINKTSNKDMLNNYIDKYGCFSCEYYNKCTMTCFVMNDHVSYKEELDDCLYRILFKEIDGLDNKADRGM